MKKIQKEEIETQEVEGPQTPDLVNLVVDEKPAEFVSTFGDLVKNRISELVAQRKLELSQSLFGHPEGQEEPPRDPEEDDDEDNGDEDEEGDNEDEDENPEPEVASESWGQYKALDRRLNKAAANEAGKRAAYKFKSPHTLIKQPAPGLKEVPQKNTPITSNDRLRRAKFKKAPQQLLRK